MAYAIQATHGFATTREALDALHNPESNINIPRDYRLNNKDLTWMRSRLDKSTWNLHPNAAHCVRLLVAREQESVILYQEQQKSLGQAFNVSLMTAWQTDIIIKHGHGGAIMMDATAGTNNQKVSPECVFRVSVGGWVIVFLLR